MNGGNEIKFEDGLDWETAYNDETNLLKPIFADGRMISEQSLAEIRSILHGGGF